MGMSNKQIRAALDDLGISLPTVAVIKKVTDPKKVGLKTMKKKNFWRDPENRILGVFYHLCNEVKTLLSNVKKSKISLKEILCLY